MTFRDLNQCVGCSPLANEVYPHPPFTIVYDVRPFRVGEGAEGFLPLNPKSVSLPTILSRIALDYGLFQQEPAITDLDWLFTPMPRLENYLHVRLLQASTNFKFASPYPGIARSASGRILMTTGTFTPMSSHSCDTFAFASNTHRK